MVVKNIDHPNAQIKLNCIVSVFRLRDVKIINKKIKPPMVEIGDVISKNVPDGVTAISGSVTEVSGAPAVSLARYILGVSRYSYTRGL